MAQVDDIEPRKASRPSPETEAADLEQAARRYELIFLGTVEKLGPSPSQWSGFFASYQEVHYRVDAVLKGALPGDEVVVRQVVVRNSPTAEPGDTPGLSARLFGRGAKLLVMAAGKAEGQRFALSEQFGARPHSPELMERVRAAILLSDKNHQPAGPPQ